MGAHTGTHVEAPLHTNEAGAAIDALPLDLFVGPARVLDLTGVETEITAADREAAGLGDEPRVLLKTTNSERVLHATEAPQTWVGLAPEGAELLVERGVKLVGVDVQALDHPLGTFLGPHGPGPAQPHLDVEYKAETGRHIIEDFPHWEPAHKIMMTNGIPGIENIGGDIDKITGKRCTFFAFPWRWPDGEGCALRVVAMLDPKQSFRFETGR
jgi:kynurenine formamidase